MRLFLTLDGRPPEGLAGEAVFGTAGGTIGRASSCDWVLRDPARLISARHATVTFENGRFFLVDTSSNGILYNGVRRIGRSNRVQLSSGDRLSIGPFQIAARLEDDGKADLSGSALAAWQPAARASDLVDAPGPAAVRRIDPLAVLETPTDGVVATSEAIPDDFDPITDLLGPVAPSPPAPQFQFQPLLQSPPSPPDSALSAERLIPSVNGIGFGGRAIPPEARRSAPITVLDPTQTAALAGFWRGLNIGPPPSGMQPAMAEALGTALAAMLDRELGDRWRTVLREGDPAVLRNADTLEMSLRPLSDIRHPGRT